MEKESKTTERQKQRTIKEREILQKKLKRVTKEKLARENELFKNGSANFKLSYQKVILIQELIIKGIVDLYNDTPNIEKPGGVLWKYKKDKEDLLEELHKEFNFSD